MSFTFHPHLSAHSSARRARYFEPMSKTTHETYAGKMKKELSSDRERRPFVYLPQRDGIKPQPNQNEKKREQITVDLIKLMARRRFSEFTLHFVIFIQIVNIRRRLMPLPGFNYEIQIVKKLIEWLHKYCRLVFLRPSHSIRRMCHIRTS